MLRTWPGLKVCVVLSVIVLVGLGCYPMGSQDGLTEEELALLGRTNPDLATLCVLYGCDHASLCAATGEPYWCDAALPQPKGRPVPDSDGDRTPDTLDNCPLVANPDQADCDGDEEGDACEGQPDCNNNDIPDECELADGSATDLNGNELLDECELGCVPAYDNTGEPVLDPTGIALGTSVADDLSMTRAGLLCAFDVGYFSPISSTNLTVSFYEYSAGSLYRTPSAPVNLAASFELLNLPPGQAVHHHEVVEGAIIPQNVWMEVSFSRPGAKPLIPEPLPSVGSSEDLYYDGDSGLIVDFQSGIPFALNFVLGVEISEDCDQNGQPDTEQPDTDGDQLIDECDECDDDPAVQVIFPESPWNCFDGIDNDCDGAIDWQDLDCGE